MPETYVQRRDGDGRKDLRYPAAPEPLAVLLSPVMPVATEKLWTALGAAESLGGVRDQPLREAGAWGVLQAGTSVAGLSPLFPRVEQA